MGSPSGSLVKCTTLWPHGPYSPWNSPGQNTGVDNLSLLQGIFPSQELNPGLPHCRQILYQLSHQGSPRMLEWAAYPFSRGSSWPRNWTSVSCIAGGFFTSWATRKACVCVCIWLFNFMLEYSLLWASPVASKESTYNVWAAGDTGSIPGSGRIPGGGNGNTLQCSCLGNPMDRGAWQSIVHRIAKNQTQLKWLSRYA